MRPGDAGQWREGGPGDDGPPGWALVAGVASCALLVVGVWLAGPVGDVLATAGFTVTLVAAGVFVARLLGHGGRR